MSNFSDEETLRLLLEAARRTNWDTQFGPPHLRSGRFFIWPTDGRTAIPPEQPGTKLAPNSEDKDSRER